MGAPERGDGPGDSARAAHRSTGRLFHASGRGKRERERLDMEDLTARLRFSPSEGRIWFDSQPVALIHLATLAALRRELIDKFGVEEARGLLTRMGYASGSRDAALARKLRPHRGIEDAFMVGPHLRALQGAVRFATSSRGSPSARRSKSSKASPRGLSSSWPSWRSR